MAKGEITGTFNKSALHAGANTYSTGYLKRHQTIELGVKTGRKEE